MYHNMQNNVLKLHIFHIAIKKCKFENLEVLIMLICVDFVIYSRYKEFFLFYNHEIQKQRNVVFMLSQAFHQSW